MSQNDAVFFQCIARSRSNDRAHRHGQRLHCFQAAAEIVERYDPMRQLQVAWIDAWRSCWTSRLNRGLVRKWAIGLKSPQHFAHDRVNIDMR